ncbi:hypothetical protein CCAX7_30650 [Capsulimonas corticalis]|uniref:Uncharacterized protein n=1 Tax=Capsulimonas corticalis TaxID=2219043 RepID=A0A402CSN6_9BACT|nr:hypothetical protein [Capsulimonas corticalis]BDI31014.1 hypothetical protein CCAX7_30650 [Capsulimonas corticalis]
MQVIHGLRPAKRGYLGALLLGALAITALAGCGTHTDKVRDILDNPTRFADKDVTIAGEVTKVYELPLGISNLSAYRVNDDSGQIWVVSHAGAPSEGSKVGLKGRVRPEGKFAGSFLGSVIEEDQRRTR